MQPDLDRWRRHDLGRRGTDKPFGTGEIAFPEGKFDEGDADLPVLGGLRESGE